MIGLNSYIATFFSPILLNYLFIYNSQYGNIRLERLLTNTIQIDIIFKDYRMTLPLLCSAKLCVHRDCYETCAADCAPVYPGKR